MALCGRLLPFIRHMTFIKYVALALCLVAPVFGAPDAHAQAVAQPVVYDSAPLVIETATGPKSFQVELAMTPEQRMIGLMYRKSMPENAGMLFDFGSPRPVSMWMKNTYLPLDMVFIDYEGRISSVAADTVPLTETVISSEGPVRYVLELNSGIAAAMGLAAGDLVRHPAIAVPPEEPAAATGN